MMTDEEPTPKTPEPEAKPFERPRSLSRPNVVGGYPLIEASSLGTPAARAFRESVSDEDVDRIMGRVNEQTAGSAGGNDCADTSATVPSDHDSLKTISIHIFYAPGSGYLAECQHCDWSYAYSDRALLEAEGYLHLHYGKATAGRKLRESYSPTIIHGTITAYTTYCCRCDECREANTRIGQANKASRIARGIPDYVHGTNNGYISYGCRCDPCRQAASDYRNAHRGRS